MSKVNKGRDWLEKRSGTVLLVAGGLQLLLMAQHVLMELSAFSTPELVRHLNATSAGILALIGLLGFVPQLRDEVPRLARAARVVAVLGIIGLVGIGLGEPLGKHFLGTGDEPPAWFAPIFILYFVGVPLSFLLFGTASVRSHTPSRRVGVVLLLVFVSFLFYFHYIPVHVEGILVHVPGIVIGIGFVVSGYLFQTEPELAGREEPVADSTVR